MAKSIMRSSETTEKKKQIPTKIIFENGEELFIFNPKCQNSSCINSVGAIFQKPHGISTAEKKKKGPLKKMANV